MKAKYHLIAATCRAAVLALASMAAACSDTGGDSAIYGAHTPILFTAHVADAAPASRSNTSGGQWTDGDSVSVEVDGVVKIYVARTSAGATTTLRPVDADNTHCWPDDGRSVNVRAWRIYYIPLEGPIPDKFSVSDVQAAMYKGESLYQASDFLYAPMRTLAYNPQPGTGAGLTFYHQTARVVMRLRKGGEVTDDNKNEFRINLGFHFRSEQPDHHMLMCGTFDASLINPADGKYSGLTATPEDAGFITPREILPTPDGYVRCYEALVIPQDMNGKNFISVQSDKIMDRYYIPGPGDADLKGGYTYTYDLIVSPNGTVKITVASPIAGWTDSGHDGPTYETIDLNRTNTINDNRTYLLTGKKTSAPDNHHRLPRGGGRRPGCLRHRFRIFQGGRCI